MKKRRRKKKRGMWKRLEEEKNEKKKEEKERQRRRELVEKVLSKMIYGKFSCWKILHHKKMEKIVRVSPL